MSELTRLDRCPKCGKTMVEKFDYTEVNPLVTAATPNGKYSCFWCGYDDEKSSPVPEGPAQSLIPVGGFPIRLDATMSPNEAMLAGKTSIKLVNLAPTKPLAVTQGEPERCETCGGTKESPSVWHSDSPPHAWSKFCPTAYHTCAEPFHKSPAQSSPVVAGIPIRTDPTIPKDAILLAGATSIKAVNVGDLAPVVPVGETKPPLKIRR